jgi:clan AA aspartic protease
MTEGYFRDDAPRIRLTVFGEISSVEVEFVVDTGFTGGLAMPTSLLQMIGATFEGSDSLLLAGGSERGTGVYTVGVEWDGERRYVQAAALEDDPLIGIALLRENHLHIEVTTGGEVLVEPL